MLSLLNTQEWLRKPRLVVGIMSGTSLDGIDVALAEFSAGDSQYAPAKGCRMAHRHTSSIAFTATQRSFLQSVIEERQPASVICDLPFLLSSWYAAAVRQACEDAGIAAESPDAIGVHGQTLWHNPTLHERAATSIRSTWQSCSVSALAQASGLPCVGDFRAADVMLGGQGAPLVPVFDQTFLSQPGIDCVALNIGGMANITVLPAVEDESKLIAFDTGPGNVWIDAAMSHFVGTNYDDGGRQASQGQLIASLWEELIRIPFVHREGPKSTGREEFSGEALKLLLHNHAANATAQDVVHTLSCFTAWSIAQNIQRVAPNTGTVIVAGGGSRNPFIINMLRQYLSGMRVHVSDEIGIPSQSKEALCFAYLAWRTLAGLPSNLPSVTGATRKAVLGTIALGC